MLMVVLLPALCLLPFVNKAYNIDDPLFVWGARQIVAHPLDFFGFEANWGGVTAPMYKLSQNPPGVWYFIAPVYGLFGDSEIAIQLILLLPVVALGWATYLLAREFRVSPVLATSCAMLTPLFYAEWVVFTFAGLLLCYLVVQDFFRCRESVAVLLAFWIGGTFAYSAFVNWSVNARSLVPMGPSVGLLITRTLRRGMPEGAFNSRVWAALASAAAVSFAALWGDYAWANATRGYVEDVFVGAVPDRDGLAGGTSARAADVAGRLANDKAQASPNCRPFSDGPPSEPAYPLVRASERASLYRSLSARIRSVNSLSSARRNGVERSSACRVNSSKAASEIAASVQSVSATTSAERGPWSSRARSPKTSPAPSLVRTISTPETIKRTRASPSRIMYRVSACWPWPTTTNPRGTLSTSTN